MASACVSSIPVPNGSLTTSASSRPDTLLCCRRASASRLLYSLSSFPYSRFLSLPISRSCISSRTPPKSLVSFVVRDEFPTEELHTLDAPVDLDDNPVAPTTDVPDLGASNDPPEGPRLYAGNLPWTCNSQELAEVFQKVGSVEMVEVQRECVKSGCNEFFSASLTYEKTSRSTASLTVKMLLRSTRVLEESLPKTFPFESAPFICLAARKVSGGYNLHCQGLNDD